MKKIHFFFIALLFVTSLLSAQTKNVHLHLNHLLNGLPMEYMKTTPASSNYYFKIELLRYYISNIIITHDEGKADTLKEQWILVNPSINNDYDLGYFNFSKIESIELGLGIDKAHNHLDPTLYPEKHPLALQEPSMHWGWAAGYRFITFEGYAGATEADVTTNFQIHTLDDKNYKTVKLPITALPQGEKWVISLDAEYAKLLDDIKATTGPINHGAAGEAAVQMKNLATKVFSPAKITDTEEVLLSKTTLFPNPADTFLTLESEQNQALYIINALGQVVLTFPATHGTTLNISSLASGFYLVSNGKTMARFLKK